MEDHLSLVYNFTKIFGLFNLESLSKNEVLVATGERLRFDFESNVVSLGHGGEMIEIARIIDCDKRTLGDFIGTIKCGDCLFTRRLTTFTGFVRYKLQCPARGDVIVDPYDKGKKLHLDDAIFGGVILDATVSKELSIYYREPCAGPARFLALIAGALFLYEMAES